MIHECLTLLSTGIAGTDDIPDLYEYQDRGNFTNLDAGQDFDGDGMLGEDEAVEGTSSSSSNNFLRITQYQMLNGDTNSEVTFPSTKETTLYAVERNTDLLVSTNWVDSGVGVQSGDARLSITRTVLNTVGTLKFLRIRAEYPPLFMMPTP
ncbi:MAG: hypothetical protein GKR87_11185 [Kiritimatiellae bacterium]|nr:hypothetical protein [Kiritimatiellia bacterium]